MLYPDVTAILDDPEVGGGVTFQVRRTLNERTLGSVTQTVTTYDVTGNIQPEVMSTQASTTEDLMNEGIVIRAIFDFKIGANDGANFTETDEVVYNNALWRVTSVENWSAWGFTVAHATKVMDHYQAPEEPDDPVDPDDPEPTEDTNEGD